MNGPTLVRIWDAPNSTYAQRFRHSIEPFAQVLYRTAIDNFDAIPKLEGGDNIVGNATSYKYGLSTRFYAKKTVDGPRAIPREVINASIQQTYNTDARSILSDADSSVAQHRADVPFHAGLNDRAHVAVRRHRRNFRTDLRRPVQPLPIVQQ